MARKNLTIWTIGHSTRSIEEFISLLVSQDIRLLADVRRFPGSRRHPQFGKEALAGSLERSGIQYVHLPELGGRRATKAYSPNTGWRNAAFRGYADYMITGDFKAGIERLLTLADQQRTAVMCAEALWWQCHRGLIADYLKACGHEVLHIMGHDKVQEHPFTSAARIRDGELSYRAEKAENEFPFV
jgi:uncharacterized protein (DUF488 family)